MSSDRFGEVATVMQRAGYRFDDATFAPYNRLTLLEGMGTVTYTEQ